MFTAEPMDIIADSDIVSDHDTAASQSGESHIEVTTYLQDLFTY